MRRRPENALFYKNNRAAALKETAMVRRCSCGRHGPVFFGETVRIPDRDAYAGTPKQEGVTRQALYAVKKQLKNGKRIRRESKVVHKLLA